MKMPYRDSRPGTRNPHIFTVGSTSTNTSTGWTLTRKSYAPTRPANTTYSATAAQKTSQANHTAAGHAPAPSMNCLPPHFFPSPWPPQPWTSSTPPCPRRRTARTFHSGVGGWLASKPPSRTLRIWQPDGLHFRSQPIPSAPTQASIWETLSRHETVQIPMTITECWWHTNECDRNHHYKIRLMP